MSNYVRKKPVQPVRLPGERWTDILGHTGVYRVSQLGRMWSVRNNLRTWGSGKPKPPSQKQIRKVMALMKTYYKSNTGALRCPIRVQTGRTRATA